MIFRVRFSALFVVGSLAAALAAEGVAKPKVLSTQEEKRWIDAVKNHPTFDGATVLQVLQYAEKLRPSKFKIGSIDVGYGGGDGEPDGVAVGYWIGQKRLAGDSYIGLWYDIKREGASLKVTPAKNDMTDETIVKALEGGRDNFLLYIDKMYEKTCIDSETKARFC